MSIFFFKQKTAYERRISDWSSDVCSSDLGSISRVETSAPARLPSAMLQPSNRFGWIGRGGDPAAGPMAARSITTDSRVGRVARPAFEVVGVIIDQAAVAAEARPFAAGAQLLQLARTDAEVMGRLRGVERSEEHT